ncbi:GNAT family N-acetyltransferase [Sulfitobacter albidus]|uniref:GNAT family N-acetyltransferase n=1 Tax=Sulfitobacter albidus TaxID=2829501 RepID=UPI0032AF1C16
MAHDDETPVATARIVMEGRTAKIGRVCVVRALRGRGLGADLIRAAVDHARELGAARIILGAQAHAVPFYAKLGFTPFGDPYDDEGEAHQMMERAP